MSSDVADEVHRRTGCADRVDVEPRRRAVPPFAVRARPPTEVNISSCPDEIGRVPIISRVIFQVVAVVRLHQRTFVVECRGHLLVLVVTRFIDVPDRETRTGQRLIAPHLVPVLDDEVLGRALTVDKKLVRPGRGRRVQVGGNPRHRLRPTRPVLEIGVDVRLVLLACGRAGAHEAKRADSCGFVSIVIKIGKITDHMAVLVAERAQRKLIGHVRDLVVVGPFAGDKLVGC